MGGLARRIPVHLDHLHGRRPRSLGHLPLRRLLVQGRDPGQRLPSTACTSSGPSGIIAAFITAFYTFRMIFMTFWGKETRSDADDLRPHPREPAVDDRAAHRAGRRLDAGRLPRSARQLRTVLAKFLEPVFAQANEILGIEARRLQPPSTWCSCSSRSWSRSWASAWPGTSTSAAPPTCPQTLGGQVRRRLYTHRLQQVLHRRVLQRRPSSVWPSTARAGSGTTSTRRSSTARSTGSAGSGSAPGRVARPIQTGRVQN